MPDLYLDLETFSGTPIEYGTDVYARDAEILLFAWAIDDQPACVWDWTRSPVMPEALRAALHDGSVTVIAHNSAFDRTVLRYALPNHTPPIHRWDDTMVQALSHALPAKLEELGKVLGLPVEKQKLADGKRLIQLFSKPRPANHKLRRATRETHPEDWALFVTYAAQDVEAMRLIRKQLPTWNWSESARAEWHQDQHMNDRGFACDRELTQAGARAAVTEKDTLAARFDDLTGNTGLRPTQRAKFMAYMNERFGLTLTDTQSGTMSLVAEDPAVDPVARELADIAIAANKSSTAKYAALDPAISPDGRFRMGLQFAGAGRTRRWAGRLYQPQNLPSRGLPPAEQIDAYIDALKAGVHDLLFDNLMLHGAAALRGVIVAPPGKKLVISDLSNIEGRMLAWVANEHWKLQAFRDFDAGTGPDLYNITANMIIGVDPWQVSKKDRNVFGKVPDLASGYAGGVAGYQTFARAYHVRMADHWGTIQSRISRSIIEKAYENLDGWGRAQLDDLMIDELEWVASETCKLAWRARHPATVKFWKDLGDAMKKCIASPGARIKVAGRLLVGTIEHENHRWLLVKLPSGRYLTYFEPHLTQDGSIAYFGMASDDGGARVWSRCFTHGGKATGNVCQTLARDLLAQNMPTIEARGYAPILLVHDELLAETDDTDEFNIQELSARLAANPDWAPDLPLAAAGFETYRYRKE